jgi:hypothetical protein
MNARRFTTMSVLIAFAVISCLMQGDLRGDSTYLKPNDPGHPQQIPDPGIPDTVRVTSIDLLPGQTHFDLEVRLYNDEELAGISIPLTWDSPDISCVSASFAGTRIDYIATKDCIIDNANQQLTLYAIVFFENFLQPGSGLICTLHFSVAPTLSQQLVVVDSEFIPPATPLVLTTTAGFNFIPQFVPGQITASFAPTENTTWGRLKSIFLDI